MAPNSTPDDFLRVLCAHLEEVEIEFMLTGSFVSTFYGDPRTTRDLDIILNAHEPPDSAMREFVRLCLASDFYVAEQAALEPLTHGRRQFNVISPNGWKADLMWLRDRPFSKAEFERRQTINVLGLSIAAPTPEDIVVAKLEWGASTESRQFSDAVSVIRVTGKLFDLAYARKWAGELNLSNLLERAIEEARATPLD
jgi:hypothetical protein